MVWDINLRKTAARYFQLKNILLLFSIFTVLRIEWLRFPRVPSQPPQLALFIDFLLESLFVGAPPQLALLDEMLFAFLFVGAPPQLALLDEMLFAFLFVGAPVFDWHCSLRSLAINTMY